MFLTHRMTLPERFYNTGELHFKILQWSTGIHKMYEHLPKKCKKYKLFAVCVWVPSLVRTNTQVPLFREDYGCFHGGNGGRKHLKTSKKNNP